MHIQWASNYETTFKNNFEKLRNTQDSALFLGLDVSKYVTGHVEGQIVFH